MDGLLDELHNPRVPMTYRSDGRSARVQPNDPAQCETSSGNERRLIAFERVWVGYQPLSRLLAREALDAACELPPRNLPAAVHGQRVGHSDDPVARAERRLEHVRALEVAPLRLEAAGRLQREAPALFSDFEIYVADDRQEAARVAYHKV